MARKPIVRTLNGEGRCHASAPWRGGHHGKTQAETQDWYQDPQGSFAALTLHHAAILHVEKLYTEAGQSWDHMIHSGPRGMTPDNGPFFHRWYADSSTVRGGLPQDMPVQLRRQIGEHLSSLNGLSTELELREARATLGLLAREHGYDQLDEAGLQTLLAAAYPGFVFQGTPPANMPRDIEHAWNETALHLGLNPLLIRLATPGDAALIQATLTQYGSCPLTLEEIIERIRLYPTYLRFDASGNLMSGSINMDRHPVHLGQSTELEQVSERALELQKFLGRRTNRWCFTCDATTTTGGCLCPQSADDLKASLKKLNTHFEHVEHRWGKAHAVRVDFDMHTTALRRQAAVRDELIKALGPERYERLSVTAGGHIDYNVALFLTQTGQENEAAGSCATILEYELRAAADRALNIHGGYASSLRNEFDTPETKTIPDGKHSEVYLARDGYYSWEARKAMLQTELQGVPVQERAAAREAQNEIKLVMANSYARWNAATDSQHLGSYEPVFIDTGFSGSIPQKILTAEGRPQDFHARGEGHRKKNPHVRLFHTEEGQFRFTEHLAKLESGVAVEHDAKPIQTTSIVQDPDPVPTGALEQMVYRQLRYAIRDTAVRDTVTHLTENGDPESLTHLRAAGVDVAKGRLGGGLSPAWAESPAPRSRPAVKASTADETGHVNPVIVPAAPVKLTPEELAESAKFEAMSDAELDAYDAAQMAAEKAAIKAEDDAYFAAMFGGPVNTTSDDDFEEDDFWD